MTCRGSAGEGRWRRAAVPFALAVTLLLAACGRSSVDASADATPGAERPDPGTATPDAPAEPPIVNVYNWTDYIDPAVLARFSRETGIKVNYDTFVSNEILETKLLAGRSGYDVVVITATFMENQLRAGVYRPLDAAQLPNLRNLDPQLDAQFAPGGARASASPRYSVPYHWGVTAIGFDAKKILARMPEAPLQSWSLLFDPAIVARFADCGVAMIDSPVDAVGAVLAWLGRDPNSETAADLAAAEQALLAIRPYVRYVSTAAYGGDLTNGEICLALGFSGEVLRARNRSRESGLGADIRLSIPREGAVMFSDGLAVLADAPHPGNAHRLIDFLLRADVAAQLSSYLSYPNANAASWPLVDPAVRDDPSIYPDAATRGRLVADRAESVDYRRRLTRTWTRFRTGR